MEYPLAYLITFTTYGTWLHGDKRGSVDRNHSSYRSEFLAGNSKFEVRDRKRLKNPPVTLNPEQREIVLKAILDQCDFRCWFAHAIHVRSNHVHIVVTGEESPEKMLTIFKAYATRALRNSGNNNILKYWTKHGSTKYLWADEALNLATKYVRDEQGEKMSFGSSGDVRAWSESDR